MVRSRISAFAFSASGLTALLFVGSCTTPLPGLVCLPISGTITADTILAAACYDVIGDINVSEGTLTVAPGVRLIFAQSTGLNINANGRLNAVGTEVLPIELTGAEPIRGFWDGVRVFGSNSVDNVLDHVTVEYGGGAWNGNVFIDGSSSESSRVSISNSTFRESATYGIAFDADVIVDSFTGNTMTSNAMGAAMVDLSGVGILDDTNTYTGNDDDAIAIEGSRLSVDQTIRNIGAVYRPARASTISALLTIEPGVTIEFGQNGGLVVDDEGQLSAVGTETEPILLTGVEQARGSWAGIRFFGSNSVMNVLEHVTIEYGGGGSLNANLDVDGTSTLNTRLELHNCTFRESAGYGFYLDEDVNITDMDGITSTDNASGPALLKDTDLIGFLDAEGTYSGNDNDFVEVDGGDMSSPQTWPALDVPYLFTRSFTVDAALAIEAGTALTFSQSVEMRIDTDGRLSAIGTPTDTILFTGEETTAGFWAGLKFFGSNSSMNRLDYVTIEFAGAGTVDGNLELDGSSSLMTRIEVTNSTFRDSARFGIYIDQDVVFNDDIESANAFSDNADGSVRFP